MKLDLPYMPYFIGDIENLTKDMSAAEFGAFQRIINRYWITQGPLADEDERFVRIVGMQDREWKKLKPILSMHFLVKDGVWRSEWLDKLLQQQRVRRRKSHDKAVVAAKGRWGGKDEKVS